jgi:hypothetical protein
MNHRAAEQAELWDNRRQQQVNTPFNYVLTAVGHRCNIHVTQVYTDFQKTATRSHVHALASTLSTLSVRNPG